VNRIRRYQTGRGGRQAALIGCRDATGVAREASTRSRTSTARPRPPEPTHRWARERERSSGHRAPSDPDAMGSLLRRDERVSGGNDDGYPHSAPCDETPFLSHRRDSQIGFCARHRYALA
jgi:hypothetical protein